MLGRYWSASCSRRVRRSWPRSVTTGLDDSRPRYNREPSCGSALSIQAMSTSSSPSMPISSNALAKRCRSVRAKALRSSAVCTPSRRRPWSALRRPVACMRFFRLCIRANSSRNAEPPKLSLGETMQATTAPNRRVARTSALPPGSPWVRAARSASAACALRSTASTSPTVALCWTQTFSSKAARGDRAAVTMGSIGQEKSTWAGWRQVLGGVPSSPRFSCFDKY